MRRLGQPLRFTLGFGDAPAELGMPLLGQRGARLPILLLPGRRLGAQPVGGDGAGMSGRLGAYLGERLLGLLGRLAQLGHFGFGRGGLGQSRPDRFGLVEAAARVGQIGLGLLRPLGQAGAAQLEPLDVDRRNVFLARRLADRGRGRGFGAPPRFGGFAGRIHRRAGSRLWRSAASTAHVGPGQRLLDLGEPVDPISRSAAAAPGRWRHSRPSGAAARRW